MLDRSHEGSEVMFSWSKNKEKKLIKLYPHNSDEEVARIMKVSYGFVQKKAEELGLEKEEPSKREWTNEELQFIRHTYPNTPNEEIASKLGVQKWQVEHCAYRLALRKSKEYMDARIVADDNALVAEWHEEWHSGMKCSKGHYVVGKILKHMFPYHKVEEEQPIGKLWIDWIIPQLNIAVEVHGIQHSQQSDFYHKTKHDFVKGQENDWSKSEMLESQSISLIVVYHDEKISINLIKQKLEEVI
jgi:hypothetical protein